MKKIVVYIAILVSVINCKKKQVILTDKTNFDIEINRDEFSDTTYSVYTLNVFSTNDNVIDSAVFSLIDENEITILEGNWKALRNVSFSLSERRKYDLTAKIIYNGDELTSEIIEIDNSDYPDKININKITINSSILNSDGTYYVSSSYGTAVRIYFSPDALFESENYDVDLATVFYQGSFSPQTTTFNINNLSLPTRSIDRTWRQYEINAGYPLVVGSASGSTIVDDRKVYFYMDLEDLAKNGNSSANITLYYDSDDSDQGGIYSGTLEYEWVYEN